MQARTSSSDRAFSRRFRTAELDASEFGHRAHVRVAHTYLCEGGVEQACNRMRSGLRASLERRGLPAERYHETLTRSWLLAVRHFMRRAQGTTSFKELIGLCPALLDTGIMLTHYSRATLFSAAARAAFAEPDLDPIPRYER